MKREAGIVTVALGVLLSVATAAAATQPCVKCHEGITPGVVADWQLSKHAQNGIDCETCHGDGHTTATDVAKVKMPTAETCGQCHETQLGQFKQGQARARLGRDERHADHPRTCRWRCARG